MTDLRTLAKRVGCPTEIVQDTPFHSALEPLLAGRRWALVTTPGWERRGIATMLATHAPSAVAYVDARPSLESLLPLVGGVADAEVLVAVGGGSAIDAAKLFAALRCGEDAVLRHLREGTPLSKARLPAVIAVPTTAGTGAEVTPFGTVWDGARKRSVHDPRLFPSHALLDAGLCRSAPSDVAAAAALDAFSHALEAIWNRRHTPETDALATEAIRLLTARDDLASVQRGALLAGLAIGATQTALAHSLSYPLTARFGVPHGVASSFALAEVARFNAPAADRMRVAAEALGCTPEELPREIEHWLDARDCGHLLTRHLTPGDLESVAGELLAPARAANNIRPCGAAQARDIALRAFGRAANERAWLSELGSRVLSEANDLKRTPDVLAKETGVDLKVVNAVIDGTGDSEAARALLMRMAATYPIPLDEVWLDLADTDEGARVMREADSRASGRVFVRRDRSGRDVSYYEYRDTAMSRVAPFKPEWVQPLRFVNDYDPDNLSVAFNNGHLLHQLTFYIGEVNVYWVTEERRFCARMNTGDSSYMAPFVPHSFTSRDPECPGLILAVTYTGEVHPALQALGRLNAGDAADLSGDLRDAVSAFGAIVRRYAAADSLSPAGLAARLVDEGVIPERARCLSEGLALPGDDIQALARVLGVRPADLLVTPLGMGEDVVIRHAGAPRPYPDAAAPAYWIRDLARTPHQPGLRGFDFHLAADAAGDGTMRHHLHEYVYNYGGEPVALEWAGARSDVLEPGASTYFEPMVAHRFRAAGPEGRLAVIRTPGRLTDAVLREYATYGPDRARAVRESKQWFEGKSA
jgi:alcohol dehydrogenase class IV